MSHQENSYENETEYENLEKINEKMNKDIRCLWENVIVPYLRNDTEKQILNKLDEHDYIKFYEKYPDTSILSFFIGNNFMQ